VVRSVDVQLLRAARAQGRALVGFSIYNLEQGMGVLRAAEGLDVPVLLQAGSGAFRYAGRRPLAQLALALAHDSTVPVGVHLDHSTDMDEVRACLELGYSSVMFDGSARPFEDNLHATRDVVELARRHGAWVEAELAGIAGDEDASTGASAGALTDPSQAAEFVRRTGVDALAVAVGNVHGIPSAAVRLDLDLLEAIADVVDAPLVLHGASGLTVDEVQAAIRVGVAKLNVNAELRRALVEAVIAVAEQPPSSDAVAAWMGPIADATCHAAQAKLEIFTAGAVFKQKEEGAR
jgi:fructose-bisphosphate aldolase class II/tagatose 1,6-diphosphate aldolase GatY/KbaY